jgi:hypothetical protein
MKLEIHFEFRVSLRNFQDLNFWDATVGGYKYPTTTSTPTIQAFITLHSIQEQNTTLQDTNQRL